MATYNFKCIPCEIKFEDRTRKFGDNSPPICHHCGQKMIQVIGSNDFVLKGSGWYKPGHYGHNWKMKERK